MLKNALLGLLIVSLVGCTLNQAATGPASSLPPHPPASAGTTEQQAESSSPDESTEAAPGPSTNARGNIVKQAGDEGAVLSPSGETLLTFKVTKITPNYKCTAEYPLEPSLGNALAIEIEVTLSAKDVGDGAVRGGRYDWDPKIIKADGTTENGSQVLFGCAKNSEELPVDVGPGEHAKGLIVVDTAQSTGAVVLSLFLVENGWEYSF